MKTIPQRRFFYLVLAFALLTSIFTGCKKPKQKQPQPKPASKPHLSTAEYKCYFANTPIVIDGKIDEPVWTKAEMIKNFFILGSDRKAPATTVARILWNHN